ncbi:MAG TPA: protein-L-isoaspartate(D-aspartate) O-methyltransferase [Solirubrobacteraceae bacterium]|nr:protein-L-isoaspartate(D-aspartate) O-methyltransferase [Solirubrobacteraceae bacterium]
MSRSQAGPAGDALRHSIELAARLRPMIRNERTLEAIAAIPREWFVPTRQRFRAYENVALPIACGQTISQPLVVARMLDLLDVRPGDRVLDVGTGSGYHAALLAALGGQVSTIERHPKLTEIARRTLSEHGFGNVTCIAGDGCLGLPEAAPFDAINVAAAGVLLPEALEDQLAPGGRLVAPVGGDYQYLTLVTRTPGALTRVTLDPVRFVPLVHDAG